MKGHHSLVWATFDVISTNHVANIWFGYDVGLVKAARLEASYPDGTELKIVVHHRGCPDPVNFTASVLSELDQVVAKVLVGEYDYLTFMR